MVKTCSLTCEWQSVKWKKKPFCRLAKIKEWVDTNDSGAVIIPLSGALEYKVMFSLIAGEFITSLCRLWTKQQTGLSSMLIFFIFSGYRSCRWCMNFAFCASFGNFVHFNYTSSFVYPSVPERTFQRKLFLRTKINDSNEWPFDDSMPSFSNSCSS